MKDSVLCVKDRVLLTLEDNEKARNSDTELFLQVNIEEGNIKEYPRGYFIPKENKHRLTPYSTCSRVRRYIQNKIGLYLPDLKVLDARNRASNEMKEINKWIQ